MPLVSKSREIMTRVPYCQGRDDVLVSSLSTDTGICFSTGVWEVVGGVTDTHTLAHRMLFICIYSNHLTRLQACTHTTDTLIVPGVLRGLGEAFSMQDGEHGSRCFPIRRNSIHSDEQRPTMYVNARQIRTNRLARVPV